ncbi:MAG TPA: DUF692 family multinuclear iron-containing protein [Drouetiella sp.]|jgi:uncharacterized protein
MTNNSSALKKNFPTLGVGLGLRAEVAQQTLESTERIDWLEIISEQYMNAGGASRDLLERAASVYPIIPHGVNLSIGSTDGISESYKKSLKALIDKLNPPWWSDHLCFTSHGGVYMNELLPLPFTKETAKFVAERARVIQEYMERPFLFENITFYMRMPGSNMTEAQFLSEVLEMSDCGLLLDINNVHVNSLNHKFDPIEFLKQIPLERAVQLHMAGHVHAPEFDAYVDTHGAPIIKPVFELLKYVMQHADVKAILLERDQNFPDNFEDILIELDEIRNAAGSANEPENKRLSQPAEQKGARNYDYATRIPSLIVSTPEPPASLVRVEQAMQKLWMSPDQSDRFVEGSNTEIAEDIAMEVDANRLPIYVNVIHSSYLNALTKAYPTCAKILSPTWENIVADFVAAHPPRSHDMLLLGEAFPGYVAEHLFQRYGKSFPFLIELAKYERIETQAIHHNGEIEVTERCALNTPENYLNYRPILNATLVKSEYEYPVRKIDEKLRDSNRIPRNVKKSKTYLLTYQSADDHSVNDFEIDERSAALIDRVASTKSSYAELAQFGCTLFSPEDQLTAVQFFAEFIEDMHNSEVFTGDQLVVVENAKKETEKIKVKA